MYNSHSDSSPRIYRPDYGARSRRGGVGVQHRIVVHGLAQDGGWAVVYRVPRWGRNHVFHSTSRPPENVNRHNLPPNPTPFIGRQQELTRLAAFLDDQTTRLLTITGPGGIGKTRLALAVAEEQIAKANFPDGIYFVSLAPLSEPEAIVPAIAEQPDTRFKRISGRRGSSSASCDRGAAAQPNAL